MFVERKEYNNVITVKLVVPTGCNAKCSFCYNKDKKFCERDKEEFLTHFIDSFLELYNKIDGKNPISLDITGGEPTLDIDLFCKIMERLQENDIPSKVCRITLTTNGKHLLECAPFMAGIVNYVNISVHDFHLERRREIFGLDYSIPTSIDYAKMIEALNIFGITVSASAVIHKRIPNFRRWRDDFIVWAKSLGFIAIRFRCDVFWNEAEWFDCYITQAITDPKFQVLVHEETPDSYWCRLRMEDKFRVFFLHGVLDTSLKTKGIEYVIDTNGKCYCDYYRNTPIEKYEYEIGKIYDWVEE